MQKWIKFYPRIGFNKDIGDALISLDALHSADSSEVNKKVTLDFKVFTVEFNDPAGTFWENLLIFFNNDEKLFDCYLNEQGSCSIDESEE